MCGEKWTYRNEPAAPTGSPPRVRGKAKIPRLRLLLLRITPACAGKSPSWVKSPPKSRDHPRVCGEKHCYYQSTVCWRGSPPRVRGKDFASHQPDESIRITPACAGKRLKKAHKIKDFDPVPIRFHLVFRRFERWCSNLPMPDGNVPV